jgi:hypothetical protein
MELSIIKAIKQLRKQVRRKPKDVLKQKTIKLKPKTIKLKPKKREQLKAVVDGRELSLSQIALFYKLKPHTVYARYRVGNRGKLLIRPSSRKQS